MKRVMVGAVVAGLLAACGDDGGSDGSEQGTSGESQCVAQVRFNGTVYSGLVADVKDVQTRRLGLAT
jgi:hypothetical protein